jgi:hypothetical protein
LRMTCRQAKASSQTKAALTGQISQAVV